ncbi:MAG: sulfatase-like hydrolase/transferase [Clostridia bacterium]|nr:sulfatase-like hydrolase/transferase [Clostridia bacterium]
MKKDMLSKIKYYTNKVINSELFIIIIGLVLFVKAAIFYKLTIYVSTPISSTLMAKTFIYSMLIVTLLFLFKNRLRFIFGLILDFIVSAIMFADNLYYNYSTGFISVSQISNLQYSEQISVALKELFSIWHILYFVDILLILALLLFKAIKIEKVKTRNWKPAITYVSIICLVYGSTIPTYVKAAEQFKYNKKMQLELGTLYTFHYLDVKSIVNMRKDIKYSNKSDVIQAYNDLKTSYVENYQDDVYNFTGIAKDKNVIVLQLESFQSFLIDKTINGKELTPNLNRFLAENINVKNMMIQSYSTTADSEHSTMSSLYPLENGMAFAQYSANKYDDFYGSYNDSGYYTIYMHGNDGLFWNRNNVYGHLDIDEVDFIESFDAENTTYINEWVSDESMFEQAVTKLENAPKPFMASIVSASSHVAFDLPGLENKYEYVDIDVTPWKGTYFGNYLEAVNYTDKQFGMFIEKLKLDGLYDDTVIILFGDHYGMQMYNDEMLDYIEQTDHRLNIVETEINYINVPCGIRIPGVEHMEIDKTVSKLDIKPTICQLSGIEDSFSLGTSMFGEKDFACLNNGVIVTDDYYYNGVWYYRSNGKNIDMDNIDEDLKSKLDYYQKCMEDELAISNSVVLNNLLAK